MSVKTFKYDWGRKMTGLYCDINKVGQAYNVLLFVRNFNSRVKTGTISISTTPKNGFIRLDKFEAGAAFHDDYEIKDTSRKYKFYLVSFDPIISEGRKRIYVKVIPTSRAW